MKKYLMTGIAALAMCFGFTSCSHDIEPASQEDLNNLEAEQIVNAYNQAFIKTFGQPAANQTWGFGTGATRGITRAHDLGRVNVNGNEWEANGYTTPTLGPTEEDDVVKYVNALTTYPKTAPTDLKTYFVTQVHEGIATINTQQDLSKQNTYVAGNQMDELKFAMQSSATINSKGELVGDWVHINNFNSADDDDWGGNTLIINGGAYDFAYKSSVDSRFHNRWIGIDGSLVPNAQGQLGDYDDYYYICFDFEATNDAVATWFEVKMPNPDRETEIWVENIKIPGAWTAESAAAAGLTVNFRGHTLALTTENARPYQYESGNMVVIGNNNYTDWIVRLTKASSNPPADYDVRIIAEDLNATAKDGDLENSDWDFNDVVFDVKFTSDNDAEITLIAAGGTLPLVVGIVPEDEVDNYPYNEVHALFGVPVNYMVNTNAEKKNLTGGAPAAGREAPKINFTKNGVKASNGKDIPIYVQKTLKNGTKKWFQLTAEKGQPASKLAVNSKSSNFSYCDERQDITKKYPTFLRWVTDNDPLIWWEN